MLPNCVEACMKPCGHMHEIVWTHVIELCGEMDKTLWTQSHGSDHVCVCVRMSSPSYNQESILTSDCFLLRKLV